MQRKILVFGAGGQVGRAIMRRASEAAIGFDRVSADIADAAAVSRAFRMHPALAAVNAAGYTAVDGAESEPEAALRINRDGAMVLAAAARAADLPLVQISTDYVFDGKKRAPYREDDPVGPLNVYGRSKEAGERMVRSACPQHIILRTSWVFSAYGTNFVRTMLRLATEREELKIVDDQTGSPTSADDLAGTILSVVARVTEPRFTAWGTYHYRGGSALTWCGFAKLIFEAAARHGRKMPRLVPVTSAAFKAKAERPAYSVLSMAKIAETFGIEPRPLSESLGECLDALLTQKVL
jgi:dTDP-4-dehydrorhamnose reductase